MKKDLNDQFRRLRNLRNQVNSDGQRRRQTDIDLVLANMDVFRRPEPQIQLTQWQQSVAEARLALLNEVADIQVEPEGFFAAATRFVQQLRAGELSKPIVAMVALANSRANEKNVTTVAVSTLCRWQSQYNSDLRSLAPAVAWNNAVPEWVQPMFELWKSMEKPTLKGVVVKLQENGVGADLKRAKQYIKQLADRIRSEM